MVASAGIVPEVITKIWDYTKNGNSDEASSAQVSILQVVRTMFALPFPVGFKAALEIRGFRVGGFAAAPVQCRAVSGFGGEGQDQQADARIG